MYRKTSNSMYRSPPFSKKRIGHVAVHKHSEYNVNMADNDEKEAQRDYILGQRIALERAEDPSLNAEQKAFYLKAAKLYEHVEGEEAEHQVRV